MPLIGGWRWVWRHASTGESGKRILNCSVLRSAVGTGWLLRKNGLQQQTVTSSSYPHYSILPTLYRVLFETDPLKLLLCQAVDSTSIQSTEYASPTSLLPPARNRNRKEKKKRKEKKRKSLTRTHRPTKTLEQAWNQPKYTWPIRGPS